MIEQYNTIFATIFNVDQTVLNDDFDSNTVDNWDSITQLSLVTAIEDEFDIMLDPEDILGFKSYKEGKVIVSKYGITV